MEEPSLPTKQPRSQSSISFSKRKWFSRSLISRDLILVFLALILASCTSSARSNKILHPKNKVNSTSKSITTLGPLHQKACTNASVIATWTLRRRAAQLVIVPVQETNVLAISSSIRAGMGGIILLGNNAPTNLGSQLATLKAQSLGNITPFVMTDEEGGGVQRMANLVGNLPWARTMASTMSPTAVTSLATQVGRHMAMNGITMDLAPDLDLASGPGPNATHTDGPRSFSPNPTIATTYGLAFAKGLLAGGITPVVKHFPGEGSATANTDVSPASTPPLAVLQANDLLPFKAAIKSGLPALMVGNASVPGLTNKPSSLSSAVVQGLLRKQLGFHGLVMTDSLSAGAIADSGLSVPTASVESIKAGVDMVMFNALHPNALAKAVVQQLVVATKQGTLPITRLNNAVTHVLLAKKVSLCQPSGSANP